MTTPSEVILICGVPGSGKTWVAKQLMDLGTYVPHDLYAIDRYPSVLVGIAKNNNKPIIAEAPFRVSVIQKVLYEKGIRVSSYLINEPAQIVKQRYENRDKKPIPRQHLTNRLRYLSTDRNWVAIGSSTEILEIIKRKLKGDINATK